MGFLVELVFNLSSRYEGNSYKSHIICLLEKHEIYTYFFQDESDYFKNKWRHNCVCSISFENIKYDVNNFVNFLNKLKSLPHIFVENVFEENNTYNCLFSSKNSNKKNIHKINYENNKKNEKRERSYSETEFLLLKSIQNMCKKKIFNQKKIPATYEDYLKIINSH
jgi:hypothetical protein